MLQHFWAVINLDLISNVYLMKSIELEDIAEEFLFSNGFSRHKNSYFSRIHGIQIVIKSGSYAPISIELIYLDDYILAADCGGKFLAFLEEKISEKGAFLSQERCKVFLFDHATHAIFEYRLELM